MSEASLYERLGGPDKIRQICTDIYDAHASNPKIKSRFVDSNRDEVIQKVWEFFCSGIGGPESYSGQDMKSAHRGMNIGADEFVEVCDDVMGALDKNNVGQKEKDEVLCILYSMKPDIVGG